MQFSTSSAAIALVLGLVTAQSNIPPCAQDCISQYTSGGNPIGNCTGLDVACICRNSTFIHEVSCCIDGSCASSPDRGSAINYARGICSAAGVSISDSDFGCNANANATATGAGTATMTTTGTTTDATTTGTFTSTRTTTGMPTTTGAPNVGAKPGAYALGVGAIGGAVAVGIMILV